MSSATDLPSNAESFYDSQYSDRLDAATATHHLRRAPFFRPYLEKDHEVLDFGCGTGDLLDSFELKRKCGVEICDRSRERCEAKGIEVSPTLEAFEGQKFDRVISSHCLEHVLDPAGTLRSLSKLLRPDGLLVFVLPMNEWVNRADRSWDPDDTNKHLYSWTPLTFGNLLACSGFEPTEVRTLHHFHPPKIGNRLAKGPEALYHLFARISSTVFKRRQLLAVARPATADDPA